MINIIGPGMRTTVELPTIAYTILLIKISELIPDKRYTPFETKVGL